MTESGPGQRLSWTRSVLGALLLSVASVALYGAFAHAAIVVLAVLGTTAYWWVAGTPRFARWGPMATGGALRELEVIPEADLKAALESEVARTRRYGREFALVLAGVDTTHRRFDYRDDAEWSAAFAATSRILRQTRAHIDRVYRYGPDGFALLLPESGPHGVEGMVRRLRRLARRATPVEGEPGGPMPLFFGATFFPSRATTADVLLSRAGLALRLAERNPSHLHLDGAEAQAEPHPRSLRAKKTQHFEPTSSDTSTDA